MKKLGMVPRVSLPSNILEDEKLRNELKICKQAKVFTFIDVNMLFKEVDVLLDENAYSELVKGCIKKKVGELTIRGASIQQLIKMKKSIRPLRKKDRFDLNILQRLLKNEKEKSS